MKKSLSLIVLILIFVSGMAWAKTTEEKSTPEKVKVQIKETDDKSVVERAEEWYKKGVEAFKTHNYDEAIKCFKKAIDIKPNDATIHYSFGVAYFNKGMLDESVSEYKKALAINPNFAEAHNNLGNAYDRKGRLDEALSEYKKAVTINPDLPPANYNLGRTYYKKGLKSLAANHYYKAGLLFLKQGNKVWALRAYKGLKQTNSKELEKTLFEKLYPELKKKKSETSE
ncbi:MAG: hypothetical protein AMJ42_03915 [Deltaproteobacteria bacterium DG_8]|nr:MAG: hypothetical protein AMJ42_03915 [Deltaproteobacteria bacterium DG_8]